MESPIEKQYALLKDAERLINLQMSDIDVIGRGVELPDDIEDLKRATLLIAKRRYLEFFSNLLGFLVEKLQTETDRNLRFYLSEVRTLLEIYALLLFLTNQDENKQMALRVANILYILSNQARGATTDAAPLKAAYEFQYRQYKPFLDRERITIPDKAETFSKQKLRNLGLRYPPVEQMLKEKHIEANASETIALFPQAAMQAYSAYRSFSNYLHGNDLCNVPNGRERFWIISKCQIIGSLLIELVNAKMTGQSRKREFDDWLQSQRQEMPSFLLLWRLYVPPSNP